MRIEVKDLKKRYSPSSPLVADGVSFTIDRGETVGIMGESGCGKSTVAQVLAGIYPPTAGKILYEGQPLPYPFPKQIRKNIQILFQHPEFSFNPKMKLEESLREPCLLTKRRMSEDEFLSYMQQYGIYREHLGRYPSELSGGELQRMALARTMLMEPTVLILDEPTSMLDVVSQAQMIRLLQDLQSKKALSYLFISHDRELCRCFCSRCYRMQEHRLTPIA